MEILNVRIMIQIKMTGVIMAKSKMDGNVMGDHLMLLIGVREWLLYMLLMRNGIRIN